MNCGRITQQNSIQQEEKKNKPVLYVLEAELCPFPKFVS